MRVALKKVEGLAQVDVSLKQGKAKVVFNPQNRTSYSAIRRAITDNGFNVREAHFVAYGTLRSEGGRFRFEVSGTQDWFQAVADSPAVAEQLQTLAGQTVVIRGTFPASESSVLPTQFQVQSVEADKE